MPLTNKDRFGLIESTPGLVIPPYPKPKFTPAFIKAFPEDVKLQMQHYEEVEKWRKQFQHMLEARGA